MISTSEKHVRLELNSFFGRLKNSNSPFFVGFTLGILNGFYTCENGVTQLEVCQRKERSTRPTTPLGEESWDDQLSYPLLRMASVTMDFSNIIRPYNLGVFLIKYYGSLVMQNQSYWKGNLL